MSALKALFIGHDHVAGLGMVGEFLDFRGIRIDPVTVVPEDRYDSPWVDFEYPAPGIHDLVITVGAPWSSDQIETWASREVEFLRASHRAGIPILGICFGSQLLARALGGTVTRARKAEIGWTDVDSLDEARMPPGPWFQWHSDAFTPPAGSVELARNGVCSQAFGLGSSLGVLFHPEMTSELLATWLARSGASFAERDRVLTEDTLRHEPDARKRAADLVDGWLRHASVDMGSGSRCPAQR